MVISLDEVGKSHGVFGVVEVIYHPRTQMNKIG
jgi:hypothetical protein